MSPLGSAFHKRRRKLHVLLIVLGPAITLIGLYFAYNVFIDYTFRGPTVLLMEFDAHSWKQASKPDGSFQSIRLRMADSFLNTQKPIVNSRDELIALLGPPDNTPYFREYDMVYYLGPERGWISIDSEWLVIKLKDGVASEARIAKD